MEFGRLAKILITGGAGFIGSHLADALVARGDSVTVVDDVSTGSPENLAQLLGHPRFTFVRDTVAEKSVLRRFLADVDEVYHLAAAVGVRLIATNPIRTIETNIQPTELLLQELRQLLDRGRVVKLFLASTSEVYGKNPKPTWNEEDDLVFGPTTRPRWSYGVSKAIDEFLALAHHREYGLPVVIARFFNVVGPRQTGAYGMVLPRFVDAALAGEPLVVHDDGRQTRCFGHIADVIDMALALMNTPQALGRVFNVGSDEPITILDLARKVAAAVSPSPRIDFESYASAYSSDFEDIRCRVPDMSRTRQTISVRPKYDLDAIIRDTIAWRREAGRPPTRGDSR